MKRCDMASYSCLLRRLWYPRQVLSSALSSDATHRVLTALGSPDAHMRCIQIAGTNGKGSVAHKVAAGIASSIHANANKPLRVGLFTSPHINSFRERIQINGKPITEQDVTEIMPAIWAAAEREFVHLTRFESLTLLALEHFRRQQVEFAVLEAGLGGFKDATNAVSSTMLSVITSVSLDHTHVLGDTLEKIASEKMGIIKSGQVAAILGPSVPPLDTVFRNHAQQVGVPVLIAGKCILPGNLQLNEGDMFSFEEENCQTARTTMEVLMDCGVVTGAGLVAGLAALPACRFEVIETTPRRRATVVLDVAHNPAGLTRLFDMTNRRFPDVPLRVVFGLSSKKEIHACFQVLSRLQADNALHIVTDSSNCKSADAEALMNVARQTGLEPEEILYDGAVEPTLNHALETAGRRGEVVVVCGSFMIMHSARRVLGITNLPEDPVMLR